MIIRNFKAAAQRKEKKYKKKKKKKKRRKEGQDTKKGPAHQPAHTYILPGDLSVPSALPIDKHSVSTATAPLCAGLSSLRPSLSRSPFVPLLPATIPPYLFLSPSSLLVPPPSRSSPVTCRSQIEGC